LPGQSRMPWPGMRLSAVRLAEEASKAVRGSALLWSDARVELTERAHASSHSGVLDCWP
jgi:hypothetical protein